MGEPLTRRIVAVAAAGVLALGGATWTGCGGDGEDEAQDQIDEVQEQVEKSTEDLNEDVQKEVDKAQKKIDEAQEKYSP